MFGLALAFFSSKASSLSAPPDTGDHPKSFGTTGRRNREAVPKDLEYGDNKPFLCRSASLRSGLRQCGGDLKRAAYPALALQLANARLGGCRAIISRPDGAGLSRGLALRRLRLRFRRA